MIKTGVELNTEQCSVTYNLFDNQAMCLNSTLVSILDVIEIFWLLTWLESLTV